MMIYELALVEDRGSHWAVTNVTKNSLDNLANREEKALKLSYMSYKMISEAIMEGKAVHIHKAMRTDEVLPGEFDILESDETDALQDARNAALTKVRMLVSPDLSKISGFALYGFMILNNDLVAAGYPITNENREEMYLKILETGDEKLITKLEDYLNYKDEIEAVAHLERKFSTFKKQIKTTNTVEEVKSLQNEFLERFYTNF